MKKKVKVVGAIIENEKKENLTLLIWIPTDISTVNLLNVE